MHPRTQELLTYLDDQRDVLRRAFLSVPAPLRDRPPAPESWSTAGVIEHLAIVERRTAPTLLERISTARTDGAGPEVDTTPVLPTFDLAWVIDRTTRRIASEGATPTGLTADAAWTALEQAGAAVREVIQAGDGLGLSAVTMSHARLGTMPLYYFFAFIGAHEARHAAQIREIAKALAVST
jgi:DinB superfamily